MLDGALALALPTKRGQWLRARALPGEHEHRWSSLLENGKEWFSARFTQGGTLLQASDAPTAKRLQQLFQGIAAQRPGFWAHQPCFQFETQLEFPRDWGLGSSSTLVAALARWANVDPFQLLTDTFGGSGYDIACAHAKQAVLFQRRAGQPAFLEIPFVPSFKDHIAFVHLGRKQDSREGIERYRQMVSASGKQRQRLSELTLAFLQARDVYEAMQVLEEHEAIVGEALRLPLVKAERFPNFPGTIKSLGAWGGDFVMALSDRPAIATKRYFKIKGFETALSYEDLV